MTDSRIAPEIVVKKLLQEKYSLASCAFLAGSIMRKEATKHSDLDIVILYDHLEPAFRASNAFKQIICKVKKIVIIGYGFNDPHINDRLFEAVQQKIPLIIINPSPWNEFKSNKFVFEEHEKDSISNSKVMFEGIAKYYEREFNEFLSSEILSVDQFNNFKNFLTS
jgi:predicted nucleotidyltransferase